MSSILPVFFQYYGLDWLSVLLGLIGTYMLGEHRKEGFLLIVMSVSCAASVAVMAETYAFLVANLAAIFLNIRGYIRWGHKKAGQEIA